MKYLVTRTTIATQEVEARDYGDAIDEAEHYPFESQWEEKMTYMVEKLDD